MLKQKNRFHGHGSLRFLYRKGQAIRSSSLTTKYIHNPHRRHSRFTVVISKKVIKSAVKRNRLRRVIYEIIRLEMPTIKDHYDVAVMVFNCDLLNMKHNDLKNLIKQSFSQAGLYK